MSAPYHEILERGEEASDRSRVQSIVNSAVSHFNSILLYEIRRRGISCTHTRIEITAGGATTGGDLTANAEGYGSGSSGDAAPMASDVRREEERVEAFARLRLQCESMPQHMRATVMRDLKTLEEVTEPLRLARTV